MSTAHRIANAVSLYPHGDVEEYFKKLDAMIELNSGTNDFKIVSHDSYAVSAPIPENGNTRFRITDSSLDIVDISQGYIELNCRMNLNFYAKEANGTELTGNISDTKYRDLCWFFVGLKSSAQLISLYNVYSNGRLTACKQTKAKFEQMVVYNSKAQEEINGRCGMYSVHSDVLAMRDCVCGVYVQQPDWSKFNTATNDLVVEFTAIIQIDDLLPFSGMSYFPRFAVGELELEIACDLAKNMVFCPIPLTEVLRSGYAMKNHKASNTVGLDSKDRKNILKLYGKI